MPKNSQQVGDVGHRHRASLRQNVFKHLPQTKTIESTIWTLKRVDGELLKSKCCAISVSIRFHVRSKFLQAVFCQQRICLSNSAYISGIREENMVQKCRSKQLTKLSVKAVSGMTKMRNFRNALLMLFFTGHAKHIQLQKAIFRSQLSQVTRKVFWNEEQEQNY